MPSEPVKHLPRWVPPWATVTLTQCGRPLVDVAEIGEFDEYVTIARRDGMKRAAYTYCVTCAQRATAWNPARVSRAQPLTWPRDAKDITRDWLTFRYGTAPGDDDPELRTLTALGLLVEAHRAEFDALVEATGQVSDLDAARRKRKTR